MHYWNKVLFIFCCLFSLYSSYSIPPTPSTWNSTQDGTPQKEYISAYQSILSGFSFNLYPWRAYLDTRAGTSLLNHFGVNGGGNWNVIPKTFAGILSGSGVLNFRLDLGPGNLAYSDINQLRNGGLQYHLQTLKDAGIRPMWLIDVNSQAPVPFEYLGGPLLKAINYGDEKFILIYPKTSSLF